jgi:uncharacterized SAM-binding protein YcdF (DUF218 family)
MRSAARSSSSVLEIDHVYTLKQWVGVLATPLALALVLALIAGVLRRMGRKSAAVWICTIAASIAYLGAIAPVSNALLAPLERKYSPLRDDKQLPAIEYVVVLGSSYEPRDGIPVTAALGEEGLARVTEGIRLARRFPTARLVVSGGAGADKPPSALGYATLARDLGVNSESITMLSSPRDTHEEALAIKALLGEAPFLLVTSAYHMPRAVWLMEREGARPIAAPTWQRVRQSSFSLKDWIPSSGSLRRSECALHEYLGLIAIATGVG